MRSILSALAIAVLCLGSVRSVAQESLRSVASVKALNSAEADTGLPVAVEGTVTLSLHSAFVLHDGEQGVYVHNKLGQDLPLGTRIALQGRTESGDFAPALRSEKITVLGAGPLPSPREISGLDLESGSFDCQWVSVEGWLRNVQAAPPHMPHISAYATLAAGQRRLRIEFSDTPLEILEDWIGSKIRLDAVCLHFFNTHGQVYGTRLIIPSSNQLTLVAKALAPAELPFTSIDSLLRFTPTPLEPGRVHIRGVVTHQTSEREVYVQNGDRGVFVNYLQSDAFEIGDSVEVVGFTRQGVYSPEIEDAMITRASDQLEVKARTLDFDKARTADSSLIQIEAQLIDSLSSGDAIQLALKTESGSFTAELPSAQKEHHSIPARGSMVRLTGVVRVNQVPTDRTPFPWKPDTFALLLRGDQDIETLKRPPLSLALWALATATLLVSSGLIAAALFWWRSRQRLREEEQDRIVREAEFAAIIKERMRLARDMHDNLAQGFTALSIHLETTKHLISSSVDSEATDHIDQARQLVRDSLAEARRSIQGLRYESLTRAEFQAALRRSAKRILLPAQVTADIGVEGELSVIGAEMANELIAIANEAMTNIAKHAKASTARVSCSLNPDRLQLLIEDDGVGFTDAAKDAQGYGIIGMQERAARFGGALSLSRSELGGAKITASLPGKPLPHD